MKIKTSDLTGAALDWAVAKCWYTDRRIELTEGKTGVRVLRDPTYSGSEYSHWFVFFGSTNWSQGGPIIDLMFESGLLLTKVAGQVRASMDTPNGFYYGPTPLIAAMRCYVASKLGDEVEIPKKLL